MDGCGGIGNAEDEYVMGILCKRRMCKLDIQIAGVW